MRGQLATLEERDRGLVRPERDRPGGHASALHAIRDRALRKLSCAVSFTSRGDELPRSFDARERQEFQWGHNPWAPPSEGVDMTDNDIIDGLIHNLYGHDYGEAIEELLAIGEPALHRLMQVMDGTVTIPLRSKADDENRQEALIRLGRLYKDRFLRLIYEEPKWTNMLSVVWASGFINDDMGAYILVYVLQRDNAFLGFAAHQGLKRRGDPHALEALAHSEPPLVHLLPPRRPKPNSNLGGGKGGRSLA